MARKKKLITQAEIKAWIPDGKKIQAIQQNYTDLETFMQACDEEAQHYIMKSGWIYALQHLFWNKTKED